MRDDTEMYYCERCGKDSKIFNLEVSDVCQKCGLDIDEGMEIDEWSQRSRDYLELIKVMASFIDEGRGNIAISNCKARLSALREYGACNPYSYSVDAATEALKKIDRILVEED